MESCDLLTLQVNLGTLMDEVLVTIAASEILLFQNSEESKACIKEHVDANLFNIRNLVLSTNDFWNK